MTEPSSQERVSPPWLLITGLLLGVGLLALMAWDSIAPAFKRQIPSGGSAHIIELTNANWQKEVVESDIPVLVDFWAPWCKPCRDLSPTIDSLAAKYQGKVKVGKLNVDDAQEISAKYQIKSIPCVMIFKGGAEPRVSFVGVKSEAELSQSIETLLAKR